MSNAPLNLLMEGWINLRHPYAQVHQSLVLALLQDREQCLMRREAPRDAAVLETGADAGLTAAEVRRIATLKEPGDAQVDCTCRIAFPYRLPEMDGDGSVITFMETACGLSDDCFVDAGVDLGRFTERGSLIVTPSSWARNLVVDHGFPAERVHTVPLGVDTAKYFPASPVENRRSRENLGIGADETIFLHVGESAWQSGLDLLLLAFAELCGRGHAMRLLLKLGKSGNSRTALRVLAEVSENHPGLFSADVVTRISTISPDLSQAQMQLLYGMADALVIPYRAMGLDLAPLEALACGTPAIVTAGGASDDYCNDEVALRIPGDLRCEADAGGGSARQYIEPRPEALLEAMARLVAGACFDAAAWQAARIRLLASHTWQHSAELLQGLAHRSASHPSPAQAQGHPALATSAATPPGRRPSRVAILTDYTLEEYLGGASLVNDYLARQLRNDDLAVEFISVNPVRDDWPRLQESEYDLILVTNISFLSLDRLNGIIDGRIPYMVFRHDVASLAYQDNPRQYPLAATIGRFFGNSRANFFISTPQLDYYRRICDIDHFIVTPPPIDLDSFVDQRQPDRSGVLYLGQITEGRGIEETLAHLSEHRPGLEAHFHGKVESPRLQAMIYQAGGRIYPEITRRDEIAPLMNRYSDFVYHPRIFDAFSIKMVEAELCGLNIYCRKENIGRYYYPEDGQTLKAMMREGSPSLIRQHILYILD